MYIWPDGSRRVTPPPGYSPTDPTAQPNTPTAAPTAPPPPVGYYDRQQRNTTPQEAPSGPPIADQLSGMFTGTPYAGSTELKNILGKYASSQDPNGYAGGMDQWKSDIKTTIDQYTNTFQQMFTNQIGRPPTADEFENFFKQIVTPDAPWSVVQDQAKIGQQTKGLLSDVYSGLAQDVATQKLKEQSMAATAPGSAFDTWQQAYQGSINDVEKSLQDYQTRLFEKIRPQLLTSLKSQGLLDTGALNQAFSGTAGDLASTASNYVSGLRGQAAQDVANQKYSLQSAPTSYQLNTTMANPGNMINQGQTALGNVWNNFMQNQAFNQQMKLAEMQNQNQPSLLSQYGGLILGGMAGGAGQGFGQRLARGSAAA